MKTAFSALLLLLALASADTIVQPLQFAYIDPEQEDHLFFAETTATAPSPAASAAPAGGAATPAAGAPAAAADPTAPAAPAQPAHGEEFVTHPGAPGTTEATTEQPRDYQAPAKVTAYDVGESTSAPASISNPTTNVGRQVEYEVKTPRVRTTQVHYVTFKRTGELHTAHYDINDHTVDHVAPFVPGQKKITDMHHIQFQKEHSWENRNVDIIDHEQDFVDEAPEVAAENEKVVETGHTIHYVLPSTPEITYTQDVIPIGPATAAEAAPVPNSEGIVETGHVIYVADAVKEVPKSKTTVQPVKFGGAANLNLFEEEFGDVEGQWPYCLLYTSPSPRDS